MAPFKYTLSNSFVTCAFLYCSKSFEKSIAFGESKPDPALQQDELAAWTLVANLLLNLDEVVNKN